MIYLKSEKITGCASDMRAGISCDKVYFINARGLFFILLIINELR